MEEMMEVTNVEQEIEETESRHSGIDFGVGALCGGLSVLAALGLIKGVKKLKKKSKNNKKKGKKVRCKVSDVECDAEVVDREDSEEDDE